MLESRLILAQTASVPAGFVTRDDEMNLHARHTPVQGSAFWKRPYPQVIKYMGSKAKLMDFVLEGLNVVHDGGVVCDLFAGACSLSGTIGNQTTIVTNDIQSYSSVIAHAYLHRLSENAYALDIEEFCQRVQTDAVEMIKELGDDLRYPSQPSLEEFNVIELRNQSLLTKSFVGDYHLFLKNYSGTWWSAEQCAWIDAARRAIDELLKRNEICAGDHNIFLTCVMHAMAYCGQGTGHYAQYRDAKTRSSMLDINLYRQKDIGKLFLKKFNAVSVWNREYVQTNSSHRYLSADYRKCLQQVPEATVYADPPYAFVHYSRFYHAIETFVLYDYPELQVKGGQIVKGRYREDRHQSPFSIRSQVPKAFEKMFEGVRDGNSNLVLSYSNTALLDLPQIGEIAADVFGDGYDLELITTDHKHMTMGRRADRFRDVEEALLIAKRKKS